MEKILQTLKHQEKIAVWDKRITACKHQRHQRRVRAWSDECKSKYYWNNEIEQANEYLIEMRTKLSKFNEIERLVKEIHDYEVCEISYVEILGANKEFLNWIEEELKK